MSIPIESSGIPESKKLAFTIRLCEVAIGIVGKEPITAVTMNEMRHCYAWLQELHTNMGEELKKVEAKEKDDLEKAKAS